MRSTVTALKYARASLLMVLALLYPGHAGAASRPADGVVAVLVDGKDGNLIFSGTGVVVRADEPIIVTCYHVVQGHSRVAVKFNWLPAPSKISMVAAFPHDDVAFLQVDPKEVGQANYAFAIADPIPKADEAIPGKFWWLTPEDPSPVKAGFVAINFPTSLVTLGTRARPRVEVKLHKEDNGSVIKVGAGPVSGDSGAPVTTEKYELTGLVAGDVGADTNTIFGVPVLDQWKKIIAVPSLFTADLPANLAGGTRYGDRIKINRYSSEIQTYATESSDYAAVAAAAATPTCRHDVASVVGGYENPADIPEKYDANRVPSPCAQFIVSAKPSLMAMRFHEDSERNGVQQQRLAAIQLGKLAVEHERSEQTQECNKLVAEGSGATADTRVVKCQKALEAYYEARKREQERFDEASDLIVRERRARDTAEAQVRTTGGKSIDIAELVPHSEARDQGGSL